MISKAIKNASRDYRGLFSIVFAFFHEWHEVEDSGLICKDSSHYSKFPCRAIPGPPCKAAGLPASLLARLLAYLLDCLLACSFVLDMFRTRSELFWTRSEQVLDMCWVSSNSFGC